MADSRKRLPSPVKPLVRLLAPALLALALADAAYAAAPLAVQARHEAVVRLKPAARSLQVTDRVTLSQPVPPEGFLLLLHQGLRPRVLTPGGRLTPYAGALAEAPPFGEAFLLTPPPGEKTVELAYGGELFHPVEAVGKEYARGFSSTPGIVSEEGAVLSGASLWLPSFGDGLVTFDLTVELPTGWDAVSQGERARRELGPGGGTVRWVSADPQDEVFLIAAPFTLTEQAEGGLTAMSYLRAPDPALAKRLNDATLRFAALYGALIGPYPFTKFAAVENFWETGFGMPSFTLLGPKVIRFPFLLRTSYPHEILHNWWGNGVYADYGRGNWAEGLTAYLADHLMAEQTGGGADYRRETLQKYADYVTQGLDAPLSAFTSRHSSATEAIGYGKSLFLFHMLRRELGDEAFVAGLRRFYAENLRRRASWEDLRGAFEAASGRTLGAFFSTWVERPGAPSLALKDVRATRRTDGEGWRLEGVIEQVGTLKPFTLAVPLAVTLADGEKLRREAEVRVVALGEGGGTAAFSFAFDAEPARVDLDPSCDVFRLLDSREIPPALSGAFGAPRSLIVLPAAAPPALLAAYRTLADAWRQGGEGEWEIALDADLKTLPGDRGVWVFGWENRFLPEAKKAFAGYPARFEPEATELASATVPRSGHAVVATARGAAQNPLTLLAADAPEALPGLARKLPHYHKYSYLGFAGSEPANVAKGRWEPLGSPLVARLRPGVEAARLPQARALAELPETFPRQRLLETVERLAAPELEGRGVGTAGHDKAAALVAKGFELAGLKPAGDAGGWFQAFEAPLPGGEGGKASGPARFANVLGLVPGTRHDPAGALLVVGAHYDGQGDGRWGGKSADRGRLHPGADDNASGVAVLLELARHFAAAPPERSLLFAAFDGEELSRLGSLHYVTTLGADPAGRVAAMLNLDTVGRLGRGKILALGAGSAREWIPLFQGVGFVVGANVEAVTRDLGSSDQTSFIDRGIPAVQLFTGPHADYHGPGDTPDRIDAQGLSTVAAVAKEALEYLANRAEPLTPAAGATRAGAPAGGGPSGERKVSFGVIPDFAFEGPGVRLGGVTPGSPAEKAGLAAGDVLLEVNGKRLEDLKGYAAALKALGPGDRIQILFERAGAQLSAEAALSPR